MDIERYYDVVIIGSGPAGLQAAIHAARKKVSVLVLGKEGKSSLFEAHVENFYGLFNSSGKEMLKAGRKQAENFGATFLGEDILKITSNENRFYMTTENSRKVECKAIIIATGTARNKLKVKGEKDLLGKGVSYCVDCDGNFYRGEDVVVVGGESAAADGALTLLEIAGKVHLICDDLKVTGALKEKLKNSEVIVHEGKSVKEITGNDQVESIEFKDGTAIRTAGVFIELGAKGLMELATNLGIGLDDDMKFIKTNKKQETNMPGIFAAGDICGPPWQMAKAVGEGCVAGIGAGSYAKKAK